MRRTTRRTLLASYMSLCRSDRRLTFQALWTLISVRARLTTMSWQRFSRRLGEPQPGEITGEWEGDQDTLLAVVRAVERWRRLTPQAWSCLVRAIAGQRLLAKRGIPSTLVLGLRPEGKTSAITAHGWLRVGQHVVLGEKEMAGYTPLASFNLTTA